MKKWEKEAEEDSDDSTDKYMDINSDKDDCND